MKTDVSIIIPLYNCEKYIKRCLLSIKNQTYKNYEVIIVDDGSKDNSANIVKQVIYKEKRFKYYYKKNGGVSTARNYGIKKSTGKWICFIDADDMIEKDCLECLVKNIDKTDDYIIANHKNYYSEQKIEFTPINDKIDNIKKTLLLNILDEKYSNLFSKNNYKSARTVWGKLYKTNIIKNNKIEFKNNIKLFEDGLFNLEYLNYCNNIKVCKEAIYLYYISQTSATTKYYPDRIQEDIKKISIVKKLLENYSEDKNFEMAISLFQFNLFCSYLTNTLFNKENNKNKNEKIKELSRIINENIYGNFKYNILKYLKNSKKILLVLIKCRQLNLISILLTKRCNEIER